VLVVQAIQTVGLTLAGLAQSRGPEGGGRRLASIAGGGVLRRGGLGPVVHGHGLSPVGPVRAVGVVEMPVAALAGRRLFKERLTLFQMAAGGITAVGVVMAALG
jgi:hypothetical protein